MKAELLLQLSDYISYKYSCCVVYHHRSPEEIRNHFNQKAQTTVVSATISPAFKLFLHLFSLHVQMKTKAFIYLFLPFIVKNWMKTVLISSVYLAWFLGSHSEPLWLLRWSRRSSSETSHCDASTSSLRSEETESPAGRGGRESAGESRLTRGQHCHICFLPKEKFVRMMLTALMATPRLSPTSYLFILTCHSHFKT